MGVPKGTMRYISRREELRRRRDHVRIATEMYGAKAAAELYSVKLDAESPLVSQPVLDKPASEPIHRNSSEGGAMKRKLIAITLAWLFWWIPIGLHRLVMRQKYWWAHTICWAVTTYASTRFLFDPQNIQMAMHYRDAGIVPPVGQYVNTWLLVFAALWMVVVLYDLIAVFFFRLPDGSIRHE